MAEVEEDSFQVLLGSGAYVEANELRRSRRIDVVDLDVGAHLIVEQDADRRDGGEAVEEGSGVDLGGSLWEGGALLLGLEGRFVIHLLSSRYLSPVGEVRGIAPGRLRDEMVGGGVGDLHGGTFWPY